MWTKINFYFLKKFNTSLKLQKKLQYFFDNHGVDIIKVLFMERSYNFYSNEFGQNFTKEFAFFKSNLLKLFFLRESFSKNLKNDGLHNSNLGFPVIKILFAFTLLLKHPFISLLFLPCKTLKIYFESQNFYLYGISTLML